MATFEQSTPEMIIREVYPATGAQILQLTSCPAINSNIYGEVAYMDAASRYVMFIRHHDSVGSAHLWRHDFTRRLVTKVIESKAACAAMPSRRTTATFTTSTSSAGRRADRADRFRDAGAEALAF